MTAETTGPHTMGPVNTAPVTPASSGTLTGPWDNAYWFAIDAEFQSKSNDRRGRDRAAAAALIRRRKDFNLVLRLAARAAQPHDWVLSERGAAVAQRPAVVGFCFAHSLIDAGNLSKSIYDALEGIVYVTDASVRYDLSMTMRHRPNGPHKGLIAFAQLPPAATPVDLVAAGGALSAGTLAAAAGLFDDVT